MNVERVLTLAASLDLSDPRIKIMRNPTPGAGGFFVSVEAYAHGATYASASAATVGEAITACEADLAMKLRARLEEAERSVRDMRRALGGESST